MRSLLPVLVLVVMVAGVAWSQPAADTAKVGVNGKHILQFRADAGGFTAVQREAQLEKRVTEALCHTEYLVPVTTSYRWFGDDIGIYANGVFVVTCTPADAAANAAGSWELARCWAASLKSVLEACGPVRHDEHGSSAANPAETVPFAH